MYGLIGRRLAHSYSPQIHALLGDYQYRLFEMEENEVAEFLNKREFNAINVTIPYKKTVMQYLDRIDDEALKIGSVNTIVKESDGSLTGHNTDYYGFSYMLKKGNIDVNNKKVLILGSGGASLTARCVVKDLNASEIVIISRSGENNYDNIEKHSDADIIINTTPIGMYPNNLVSPVNLDCFNHLSGVCDMIYNPKRTKLILDAEERNINCISGLYMLTAQAKKAAEYLFDKKIDDSVIDKIVNKLSFDLTNIILIGMPGCGKTTIGKIFSQKFSRDFVDTDDEIIKKAGKSIPEIFREQGEKEFRRIESDVAKEVCKEKGLVIATGGGIVVTPENYYSLRQNGTVIFINRDTNSLPTDGRPLSQTNDINEMFKKRLPLYRQFANYEIDGNCTVNEAAERIEKVLV